MILFILVTISFLNSGIAKAGKEGGHTGNGGGKVSCPGRAPVMLDYYEAEQQNKKLLPIEKMDRQSFFKLMIKRLKLGGDSRNETGIIYQFNFHNELEAWIKHEGKIELWDVINEWRVHDEFIESKLLPGCSYQQAAITADIRKIGRKIYKIKGAVEALSPGQQNILELHEFFQARNSTGSSASVRNLIGTMIKKRVTYKQMRQALLQFENPHQIYYKSFGRITYDVDQSQFNLMSGLYALDLRDISEEAKKKYLKCSNWVAISLLMQGDMVMQSFKDHSLELDEIYLPIISKSLTSKSYIVKKERYFYQKQTLDTQFGNLIDEISIQKGSIGTFIKGKAGTCPYINIMGSEFVQTFRSAVYNKTEDRLFRYGWFDVHYIQEIRSYYEGKRLGYVSDYESEVENIRKTLNW
ncbi:MAG: hypothetical protein ACOYL6_18935 [Bacteriovoracaceae bacterium]